MAREKYLPLINKANQQYGLPPGLLDGLIEQESAYNPMARSPAGAMGLMQLMPDTAKDLGVKDPFDPEQSIMGGANYLSQQMKKFNDTKLALAAYNAGPGNVQKYGGIPPFSETQAYVPKVLERAQKYGFGLDSPMQTAQPSQNQSPIQSILEGMNTPKMSMDQMKEMVGLDPRTLGRQNKMNFIGSALNGLAQVAGSLNPRKGAALQQMYADQNQNNLKLQELRRQSAIENLMKLVDQNAPQKNPLMTDDIKEYMFANQGGFKGGFEDWMKQKAQFSGNPLTQMIALERFKMDQQKNADQKIKDAKGDKLPATQASLLAEGQNIPSVLDKLDETLSGNTNVGGPLKGYFASMNPYDTQTQDIQAQINAAKQFVGRFLEGGVLRKEDEEKYDKIMPTLKDTPEVRAAKIKNIRILIQGKQNDYINSFEKAGYDVSGYNDRAPQSPIQELDIHTQALEWAKQNPDDPRAKKILQLNGGE